MNIWTSACKFADCFRLYMALQELPAAIVMEGISFTTTLPVPIIVLSRIHAGTDSCTRLSIHLRLDFKLTLDQLFAIFENYKISSMQKDKESEGANKEEEGDQLNEGNWIGRAEAFIDEAADKVHQSEAYRKAGKSVEKAALKIFRKAGRWWGKI